MGTLRGNRLCWRLPSATYTQLLRLASSQGYQIAARYALPISNLTISPALTPIDLAVGLPFYRAINFTKRFESRPCLKVF